MDSSTEGCSISSSRPFPRSTTHAADALLQEVGLLPIQSFLLLLGQNVPQSIVLSPRLGSGQDTPLAIVERAGESRPRNESSLGVDTESTPERRQSTSVTGLSCWKVSY